MKPSVPLLSPILRSDTQGRLLAQLFAHPQREVTVSELARLAEATLPTALRDVDRLVRGGYLTERRVGRNRMIRANEEHPLYAALKQIVTYGYGPTVVIPDLLRGRPGIDAAYIYGSWAARLNGEPGTDPNDIDVLVVGDVEPSQFYPIALEATKMLGREVSINVISPNRWQRADDGFIRTVQARPLVQLDLRAS
ncbi:hypothetical protein SAMN05216368_10554 [Cryobacterium flavum]|uniref:ArsR family transcriptional regulator n=1 Tax=Cryobacterium flavum TaxID=1424659 RepID=A0A5E9FXJ4_9MICO|nr:hypothetical protein SAMN05216368_10554 [Cryobacterium flavum]